MHDLHCHLLPGVDDGATDLESAIAMARALTTVGFEKVAPSPHTGEGPGGDVSAALAEAGRQRLQDELHARGIELQLLANAEHMAGPVMLERAGRREVVPVGGRGAWLLVELPCTGAVDPEVLLFRLQTKGWRLLVAHPERTEGLTCDRVERLVDRGVRLQLNLGSFVGRYGVQAQKAAEELAEAGLAHVVASDLHAPHDAEAWMGAALAVLRRRWGETAVVRALQQNPSAIIMNADAESIPPFVEQR